MRSALLAVNGVASAQVTFEGHEALVEYDPAQCDVDTLVAAVASVKHPMPNMTFDAAVKKQLQ